MREARRLFGEWIKGRNAVEARKKIKIELLSNQVSVAVKNREFYKWVLGAFIGIGIGIGNCFTQDQVESAFFQTQFQPQLFLWGECPSIVLEGYKANINLSSSLLWP
ncbi:MAG: hypothetical protein DRR42_12170 [Gammaproteobacteria bacterium]|nr:MAG: hypothetical protein DRR42_12170 [Gammaproteobacteria bacterium]